MAQIPTFTNQISVPVVHMPLMDPNAAGQVGGALAHAGAAVSEEMEAFNQHYAQARRQADATNIVSGVSAQLGDMEFRYSKVADRNAALTGFNEEAAKLREKTLAGIKDAEVASYVERQFDSEAVARSQAAGRQAFALESSKRRGDLDTNLSNFASGAAAASSEPLRAQMLENGTTAIRGAVAAGWLDPEAGARRELTFKSQVQEVGIAQKLTGIANAEDADAADALFAAVNDPNNFPGLTPEKREILAARADGLATRLATRAAARQAHEDVLAEKAHRDTQAQNETATLADIYGGKPVDMAKIYAKAYAGEISAAGLNAIEAAVDKRTAGHDDPLAMAHLWGAIGDGVAGKDDVLDALSSHRIRGETSSEMMRALNERQKQGADQVERGAFNTLKTALSGAAIEQGFIKFDNAAGAAAIQAWGQAQGEWNRRVLLGKEDPMAVLSDLAPKYSNTVARPTWLAPPKFGAVNSLDDVKRIYAATKSAFEGKTLSPGEFEGEARLLESYRSFYFEKALRDQAYEQILPARPAAPKKATP